MSAGVLLEAHRRGHVDDSLDEFRLLDVWHGLVAVLELVAREVIPRFQGRRPGRPGGGNRRGSHSFLLRSWGEPSTVWIVLPWTAECKVGSGSWRPRPPRALFPPRLKRAT